MCIRDRATYDAETEQFTRSIHNLESTYFRTKFEDCLLYTSEHHLHAVAQYAAGTAAKEYSYQ